MLEKMKSNVRVTYPPTVGNMVMRGVQLLFMAGGLFFGLRLTPAVYENVFFCLLAILWGINYIRFRKNTGIGLVKCCSMQLIVCGLLGAALSSFFNQMLPESVWSGSLITLVLLAVTAGINFLCFQEKRTVYEVAFLVFPYCILCADFFLVTGFLSAILLMVAFFSGTLAFEHQRMDDDEYFGNSGR